MRTNERSPDIAEVSSLLGLAEFLGLVETSRMRELRNQMPAMDYGGHNFRGNYRQYEEMARKRAESQGVFAERRGDIALMIMKALIYRACEDQQSFDEAVEDARGYARQMSDAYPEDFGGIAEAIERVAK